MRLWVPQDERRPEPAPLRTDDRKAVLTGMVVWIVALGAMLLFLPGVLGEHHGWWLWTVLVGLGIGLVLLVYVHRRQS
jgi:O-antigen/teichoic acid export membrane protein